MPVRHALHPRPRCEPTPTMPLRNRPRPRPRPRLRPRRRIVESIISHGPSPSIPILLPRRIKYFR